MNNVKQKEEPFHVRCSRLKKSIIKSRELLTKIASFQQSKKFKVSSTEPVCKNIKHQQSHKKAIFSSFMISQLDLLHINLNSAKKININQMRYSDKVCKELRLKETGSQMIENGLAIKKINIKSQNYSKHEHVLRQNSQFLEHNFYFKKRKNNRTLRNKTQADDVNTNKKLFSRYTSSLQRQQQQIQRGQESISSIRPKVNISFTNSPSKGKKQLYLYEREIKVQEQRDRSNEVYQKRIKSYTEFIWKCLLSHNVYINLDLPTHFNGHKYKAFIGFGNNCNMIKSILKRRFWWNIIQEYSDNCEFIWTQTKIDKIYQKQESSPFNKEQNIIFSSNQELQQYNKLLKSLKKAERQFFFINYQNNSKILNKNDFESLIHHFMGQFKSLKNNKANNQIKEPNYKNKTREINKTYKEISIIDKLDKLDYFIDYTKSAEKSYYSIRPLIHNHLQNNFYLGNKKALFYNLKDYYHKISQDLFQYIPYTFHIKYSLKDPQFKRFKHYYQKIHKINKADNQEKALRNIWIVKPGENSNQGRGITVIDEIYQLQNILKESERTGLKITKGKKKYDEVKPNKTFIVQKYIENPFLYYQRKFDIRHYLLITNLYGICRGYWYEQGYIRTSSYPYNVNNFDREIHLTNDAIQKKYPYYGTFQPFNKLSYSQFQQYLNTFITRKYNFREEILPQMKKIALDAVRSIYTKISPQSQMHNFEIFGLDFMVDQNFKPWLLQINTNPCLDCSCPLLDRIIPYMVEQSFKLSLDLIYPPPSQYPNHHRHLAPYINLESFKYELIFDSQVEGKHLKNLYKQSPDILKQIGEIQEDQQFHDDGQEIKLQDYT